MLRWLSAGIESSLVNNSPKVSVKAVDETLRLLSQTLKVKRRGVRQRALGGLPSGCSFLARDSKADGWNSLTAFLKLDSIVDMRV